MLKMRKSFTLVELLMTIAIIGMMSAVIVVNVSEARIKSRDSQRIADLASIQLSLEKYKSSTGHYPITCQPAVGTTDPCVACAGTGGDINTQYGKWLFWAESANGGKEWGTILNNIGTCAAPSASLNKAVWGIPIGDVTSLGKFINSVPNPPQNNQKVDVVKGPCGNKGPTGDDYPMSYLYRSDDGQSYKLMTYLESRCNGINDGGLFPQYYEVFNSSAGQALEELLP